MSELPKFKPIQPPAKEPFAFTILESCTDRYAHYLSERHYATTTIKAYVNCVVHFTLWVQVKAHRVKLTHLNEALITRFLVQHLPNCQCTLRCWHTLTMNRAALKHLMAMLRLNKLCPAKQTPESDVITMELKAFDHYLACVRGLSSSTRSARWRYVRDFLFDCFGTGSIVLATIKPADVMHFMTRYTARLTPASICAVNVSLRSYFAFRATKGEPTAALSAALPQVAQWRLAGLPQQLSEAEIQQLLGAYNRRTATGKRDYAMTRCLLDLGLRQSEVARLHLCDIDWQSGILTIRGKGKRLDRLPLPQATGHAIVQYLQGGRPQTTRGEVFVRHRPPTDGPAGPGVVSNAVRYAAKRCGLQDRIHGTHILRHTLAARLVQRGARFKEIADVLRHRSLDTTTIYAKVDLQALSAVALPWPGRQA